MTCASNMKVYLIFSVFRITNACMYALQISKILYEWGYMSAKVVQMKITTL